MHDASTAGRASKRFYTSSEYLPRKSVIFKILKNEFNYFLSPHALFPGITFGISPSRKHQIRSSGFGRTSHPAGVPGRARNHPSEPDTCHPGGHTAVQPMVAGRAHSPFWLVGWGSGRWKEELPPESDCGTGRWARAGSQGRMLEVNRTAHKTKSSAKRSRWTTSKLKRFAQIQHSVLTFETASFVFCFWNSSLGNPLKKRHLSLSGNTEGNK